MPFAPSESNVSQNILKLYQRDIRPLHTPLSYSFASCIKPTAQGPKQTSPVHIYVGQQIEGRRSIRWAMQMHARSIILLVHPI